MKLLLLLFILLPANNSFHELHASYLNHEPYSTKTNASRIYLIDDFEQGTLTGWSNLQDWENSEATPISGNYSLKHSTGVNSSFISHPLQIPDLNSDTITWRLQLKNGNWDPSGANRFWFYLTSDRANISTGANGYAIGVNFTGTDDRLRLWRITAGTPTPVISSTLDWNENTLAGIEVTRFPGGRWELKINRDGGFVNLISSGSAIDNTHRTSQACGLMFFYTSTRIGLLWMDDVYVGKPIPDIIPPVITKSEILTVNTIALTFSELLETQSALEISNYSINNIIHPVRVEFLQGSQQSVILHFTEPFAEKTPFVLRTSGIKDRAGNLITPADITLEYESFKPKSLRIIGNNRLKISFNRDLNALSAETEGNYTLLPGNIHPGTATVNTILRNEVFIDFSIPFTEKLNYTLRLENIRDVANDLVIPSLLEFVYFNPAPYDVIINEIMARPNPSFGLPGFEYIELHNTTIYPVDLTGWTIRAGTTTRTIPEYIMAAGEYLILCHPNNVAAFGVYGETLGTPSFPSLTDAGATISLWNNNNQVISTVTYTDQWYGSSFKAAGGWSLEKIDPKNPCAGDLNWKASMHPSGGTPGKTNSIRSQNPDVQVPVIHRAVPISSTILRMFFTEPFHYLTVSSPDLFIVDNQLGHPIQVIFNPPDFMSVELVFAQSFNPGVTYTITVNQNVTDCAGNRLGSRNSVKFAMSIQPENFDLVVNEILFNPFDGGVDFVEVYNRSNKVINLQNVLIASRNLTTRELQSISQASPNGFLIFPSEYSVITTNAGRVLKDYYSPNIFGFSEIKSMPAFNNDKGNVVLLNNGMEIIDEFTYNEQMHYTLLPGVKGVSLERINFNTETNKPMNWHSASQAAGFATPAYQNSQFNHGIEPADKEIIISPEVFSPDNDGFDDVVYIYYEFDKPGFIANTTIFDARGRIVKKLTKNQLLGTSGFLSWDGTGDAGQMSQLGIYLILIDLFHSDGTVKQFKKTCVLAGKIY